MDTNQRVIELTTAGPMKLSAALEEKGVSFPMPCGGNGRCGKCAVQFLAGAPEAGGADRARFSEEELRNGWRLGCRAEVCGTCRVRVLQARQELEILSSFGVKEKTDSHASGEKGLGIGIDIGTTTSAMSLLDLASGVTVKTHTRSNPQRSFGADVLTRIQRANEGQAGRPKRDEPSGQEGKAAGAERGPKAGAGRL